MPNHGGARGGHAPDCPCPACRHRRAGKGHKDPVRSMRLPGAIWEWLRAQPDGPSQWVQRAVLNICPSLLSPPRDQEVTDLVGDYMAGRLTGEQSRELERQIDEEQSSD